jgi:diguanylate cyclase (GGDEF)-like protein
MRYRKSLAVVYGAILAFNLLLTLVISLQGERTLQATRPLIEEDLPLLERLSYLKVAVVDEEPTFYEYLFARDRERFLARHGRNRAVIEAGLAAARVAFAEHPALLQVEHQYRDILDRAARLDRALQAPSTEREGARALIEELAIICADINATVDLLVGELRRMVAERGALAQARVQATVLWVVGFAAVAFMVAVLIGYHVHAYLAEARERRRLGLFPERNPNPVLSLARDGTVLYANPGAATLLERLGFPLEASRRLLPPDIGERLAQALRAGEDTVEWEHEIGGRILDGRAHWLSDPEMFHAYLVDVTERKRAERTLAYLAHHDPLTGLPNRRRFERDLEEALGRQEGFGTVMLLNVDRLRRVVDSLGHTAADEALRTIGRRLASALDGFEEAAQVLVYRFEGDLFAVLIAGSRVADAAVPAERRVREAMLAPLAVRGHEVFVTFSIGYSLFPVHGRDGSRLLAIADAALHQVRLAGGNGMRCGLPENDVAAAARLEMEALLQHALERNELEVHYQPQIGIDCGALLGAEALVRWHSPALGWVPAATVVPLAEETGLIAAVGTWVLRTACRQGAAWNAAGSRGFTIAVNLSARQFADEALVNAVAGALAETGLDPGRLELEITEGVAMQDPARTAAVLSRLKGLGVGIAIDDFGTGYSSLSYLRRFPIDRLKIDQSFVGGMAGDAGDAALVRAIVALGHSLGLQVVAEGVEHPAQLEALARFGCDAYQGFLAAPPLPWEEFTARFTALARAAPQGVGALPTP